MLDKYCVRYWENTEKGCNLSFCTRQSQNGWRQMSISHGRMSPAGMRWEPQKEQSGHGGGSQGPLNIEHGCCWEKESWDVRGIPDLAKYWQFPRRKPTFPLHFSSYSDSFCVRCIQFSLIAYITIYLFFSWTWKYFCSLFSICECLEMVGSCHCLVYLPWILISLKYNFVVSLAGNP